MRRIACAAALALASCALPGGDGGPDAEPDAPDARPPPVCVPIEPAPGEVIDLGGDGQTEPVTWTNLVGVVASGSSLTKTAPEDRWNAGASSVETLTGDGYIELELERYMMAGLSHGDTTPRYTEIDFALHYARNYAGVAENGVRRFLARPNGRDRRMRVQLADGVVTYWIAAHPQVWWLRYTSTETPELPLLVDTSFRAPGNTLRDAVIASTPGWKNVFGVATTATSVTKTVASETWFTGSVSSAQTIRTVEFTTPDVETQKIVGLGDGEHTTAYDEIDYALYLTETGHVRVYELGEPRASFGWVVPGDRFRIETTDTTVTYSKNGCLLFRHPLAPGTGPLRFNATIRTPGAWIEDIVLER